ncbi:sugar ABC transporter ATP-binding protein [soil metagenome]
MRDQVTTLDSRRAVVQMAGITVTFPGVTALDGVDLTLYPGEVHAVMGGNGAGKSSLIKALTGVYRVDSGSITVDRRPATFSGTAEAAAAGIAVAYQDTQLCGNLSIGENVMLGHEVRGPLGINWAATHRRAAETLAELGEDQLDTHGPLAALPIALQQLVAIARATVIRPKVLVLDEPTSSLEDAEVERLFAVIRRLRDQGVAVLFVSHFLEQVYAISDRMTVLRDGRNVGTYRTWELDRAELISLRIGKDRAELRAIGSDRRAHRRDPVGPPLYRAEQLGRRGVIAATDLDFHAGEVVGFAGLRGSGRTELARMVAGVERADSGRTWMREKPVAVVSPSAALHHRIAFSTENRRLEGIVGDLSIRQNIVVALQAVRGWARPLSRAERDELVDTAIETLGISPADPNTLVRTLSGGNQQKVLLARLLVTRPRLLILDEPTRGIDVASKVQIQARIAQLAREGMSVVFISSELEEVVRLADRIIVMKDRHKIGEVSNGPALNVDSIVELIAADSDEMDELGS